MFSRHLVIHFPSVLYILNIYVINKQRNLLCYLLFTSQVFICIVIIVSDIGGLYFDNDVIVLKSFDDMRIYPMALGRATKYAVSNGIMVCTFKAACLFSFMLFNCL